MDAPEKCPHCGAAARIKTKGIAHEEFQCGTCMKDGVTTYRDKRCYEAEIAQLKAAIATPEIYAGVITRVLEEERDKAVAENAELHEEIKQAKTLMNARKYGGNR